ncbi:MAG TPA: acyl-CoA thioesterase, partial [Sphingopyxis sp.]|nr:acyl-CoA thioesterase [Sphingopyxis sp.]
MREFTLELTATPGSIDELGHVNNAVWVQWIQQVATGHWDAAAPQAHKDAYIWVVVRHEIDYLRALGPGETVTARTWVADKPQGAKFDRFMEF